MCFLFLFNCWYFFLSMRAFVFNRGREQLWTEKANASGLFYLFFSFFPPPLPATEGGGGEGVVERCACCETTPLSLPRGVSPGGVLEREREREGEQYTTSFYWAQTLTQQTRVRKEGREWGKGRWTLWGWKSCQTQTCTDGDRRDRTAMQAWLGTASGESASNLYLRNLQLDTGWLLLSTNFIEVF